MDDASLIKPERLPERDNFIEWYNALLDLAEVVDRHYPVKGTFVWMPYGIRIMKNLVAILDKKFADSGISEVLFPLFIPPEFAKQNDRWFENFKDEAFYTEGKELLLRPTGEPAMYPIFKLWIREGKMPIRVYETVSSYRNESKTTHTLIRDREITFWHEIHTVHKTRDEAVKEADMHRSMYESVWKDILNIPSIVVSKPKYEIFAGADSAYEFYSILPDGRLLENGSVNNLGQAYAKKFDLFYTDANNNKEYVWQVCTGNGARFIAAVLAVHGDRKGMVLPPKIAPIDVVVVPVAKSENMEKIMKRARALAECLEKEGVRTHVDDSDRRPGEKFNIWELKGVPLRVELGEKEITEEFYTVFRRDTNKKDRVDAAKIVDHVKRLLGSEIPAQLLENSTAVYAKKIKHVPSMEEASEWIKQGGVAKANWCEDQKCFEKIGAIGPAIEAIGTLATEEKAGKCIACGKETKKLTLIGRTY
jgi:prolyl-tRNA synthetase